MRVTHPSPPHHRLATSATGRASRTALQTVFAAAIVLVAASAHAAFVFMPPTGWRALTPATAASAVPSEWPAAALDATRAGTLALIAYNPADSDGVFRENETVTVHHGALGTLGSADLESFATAMAKEHAAAFPAGTMKIRTRELVGIEGLNCARIVSEMKDSDLTVTQTIYVIPGEDDYAVLSFSTPSARAVQEASSFELAARATKGLPRPHYGKTIPSISSAQLAVSALSYAIGIALVVWAVRRILRRRTRR